MKLSEKIAHTAETPLFCPPPPQKNCFVVWAFTLVGAVETHKSAAWDNRLKLA